MRAAGRTLSECVSEWFREMEVFVASPLIEFRGYNVSLALQSTVSDLIRLISSKEGFPSVDFYVKNNGRISDRDHKLQAGAVYHLEPRLCGGKGGFGSMLRALGAQIEKTTNREACRDLSGRRLRDVNHEKEMAEWLKKQSEREAEKEQRRLERIQRKLAGPKHQFTDTEYNQQCYELHERLEDSVLKGLQASASGMVNADERQNSKRPATKNGHAAAKKKCFWTGLGDLGDMDSSEADSDEGEAEAASSTSAAASISGVPCSSQPAVVPTTTSRGSKMPEVQELPRSSSPAPCSRTLGRGEREDEAGSEQPAEQEGAHHSNDGSDTEKAILTETEDPGVSHCFPADGAVTQPAQPVSEGPLDLLSVNALVDLEVLGLERLKVELMQRGLKCGGTLQERAARLFSVRGLSPDQISPALLAKPIKGKKK